MNYSKEFQNDTTHRKMVAWEKLWNIIDPHDEGYVSLRELERLILSTKVADDIPPSVVIFYLEKADINKDGIVSRREFFNVVSNPSMRPKLRSILTRFCLYVIPRSGRTLKVRKYVDEYSCMPPPLFIILITLAEVISFIVYSIKMDDKVNTTCPTDSVLIYDPKKRYEAWRFLSYTLIHCGVGHLVSNCIVQLFVGIILEMVHKSWRVMAVYVLGILGGSLASSIAHPEAYLAGASGAIYAIQYAHIGNLILNWSEMSYPILQALAFALFSALDVGYAIWDTFFNENPSLTGYMAHLGGALTGVLVGVSVLRNLKVKRHEKICSSISIAIFVALIVAAIIVHAALPSYFP